MHFRVNNIAGGLCFVTAMLTSAVSAHAASAGSDSKPIAADDESSDAPSKDTKPADKAKEAKRADGSDDEKNAHAKARKEASEDGKTSSKSKAEKSRKAKATAANESRDDAETDEAPSDADGTSAADDAVNEPRPDEAVEPPVNAAAKDALPSTLSPVLTIGESAADGLAVDEAEATPTVALDGEAVPEATPALAIDGEAAPEAALRGSSSSADNLLDDEVTEAPPDDARGDITEPTGVSPDISELPQPQGELLSGTRWSTPYYRMDSGVDGPTVVVVSGIHGDERSGPIAAERLLNAPLCSGVLYIIPRANQPALDTGTRLTPRAPHSNLNRNFPLEEAPPRGRLARNLWTLVSDVDPDVLLDLHEGFDYNIQNGRSVGNTILYSPQEEEKAQRMVSQMVSAVNELETADQRFRAWKPPVIGSLARATAERLGSIAMILETTTRTDLDQRIAQHTVMVETALGELGMMGAACSEMPSSGDVSTGELTADNGTADNKDATEATN